MITKFQVEGYNPQRATDQQLADDWRLLTAKYSTMRRGGKSEFSTLDALIEFSKKVFNEIKRRDKIMFHPEKMKEFPKELFQIVSGIKKAVGRTTDVNNHAHGFAVNDKGNGKTTTDNKHFHKIVEFKVLEKNGHVHELISKEKKQRQVKELNKNFILEFAEILKYLDGHILEIGCDSQALDILKRDGYNIQGTDISKSIDHNDNSFDTVFSIHAMDSIDNINQALLESWRICSKKAVHIIALDKCRDITLKHKLSKLNDVTGLLELNKKSFDINIKCQVLGIEKKEDNIIYEIGYALDTHKLRESNNTKSLGKTHETDLEVNKGDIITVTVNEIKPVKIDGKMGIEVINPVVKNLSSAKRPDAAKEIIIKAEETGLLNIDDNIRQELIDMKIFKQEANLRIKEGDNGEVVFQTHERGLTEDQIKHTKFFGKEPVKLTGGDIQILNSIRKEDWGNLAKKDSEQLKNIFKGIKTEDMTSEQRRVFAKVDPVSIHTDFRFRVLTPNKWNFWDGGEGFTPGNQYRKNKILLAQKDSEIKILGDLKKRKAGEQDDLKWLTIGDRNPDVIKPGEPGATVDAFGRIKIIDKVKFKAGVQDMHFKEYWFDGSMLKGRWIINFVPVGDGRRQWMISRPADQKMKSKLFEDSSKEFKKEFSLIKDAKKQIVYGVVYEPFDGKNIDTDGDYATAEEIEKAAHTFMEDYNHSLSLMHAKNIDSRAKVVETYIALADFTIGSETIKKGSWVMAVHVLDKKLWAAVEKGELNAFSLEGAANPGPSLI